MTTDETRQSGLVISGLAGLQRPSRMRTAIRLARHHPVGVAALAVVLALTLGVLFTEQIAPYSPTAIVGRRLEGPSAEHLLGTDRIGRDMFTRILYGARVSLLVAFLAVGSGTIAGSAIGIISGFAGGWPDLVVQRLLEVLMSIPPLLLALVIVASFGPGMANALIAIAVVLVPTSARVTRAVTLRLKTWPFVEAAQVLGARSTRILLRHIVPNAVDEVLILASVTLAAAVIIEAALSFLGLGAQPPTPSWGQMLAEGRAYYQQAPHLVWAPSLAISITVLALTMLGDTVRDIVDPKTRGGKGVRL